MLRSEQSSSAPVTGFVAPSHPGPSVLNGRFAQLERLDPERHAEEIFKAAEGADYIWDYMAYGPFASAVEYREWLAEMARLNDPCFYAIRDLSKDRVAGVASYLRIVPAHGVIEIGHILLTPALQRSAAASEALMLMIRWAFEAGYRRVEWKCNAANEASRRAALRLGFSFEGVFRQHLIAKGRNRDTAWFSIIDGEWPSLRVAYDRWLDAENFEPDGQQRSSLSALTNAVLPERARQFGAKV